MISSMAEDLSGLNFSFETESPGLRLNVLALALSLTFLSHFKLHDRQFLLSMVWG
jgi:hypothetical protein